MVLRRAAPTTSEVIDLDDDQNMTLSDTGIGTPAGTRETIEVEEEDDYLSRNPELVSLFEVDVVAVLKQYQPQDPSAKQKETGEGSLPEETGDMPDEEGVAEAERIFEQELRRSRRIKEDELLDLNLGTEEEPKNVRVSAKLDKGFRGKLETLLKSFKDVFA